MRTKSAKPKTAKKQPQTGEERRFLAHLAFKLALEVDEDLVRLSKDLKATLESIALLESLAGHKSLGPKVARAVGTLALFACEASDLRRKALLNRPCQTHRRPIGECLAGDVLCRICGCADACNPNAPCPHAMPVPKP